MIHFKAWLLELLETDAQGIVQGMARPTQPQQPVASAAPTWIKAKALQNGFGLRSGQDIAVAKLANGDWHFITLDQKRSKGTIPAMSVSKTIQSYKDAAGQPMTAKSIDALMTPAPVAQQAKPQDAKSHVLSNEKMSEEQRAIDAQFENIMKGSGSGHIMINALAGTGKTTMLKHLAWKYGNTKQKWLYLVFNTKNKVEASESFPPWVTVATTNGFLGGQDVLGSPANRRNIKATDRIVDINKHAGEDETAKKLEKARLLADGPEFDAMLNQMGLPSKEVGLKRMPQQQDRYGRRGSSDAVANTVGSLLTSIRYLFKEQVLTLLGLAKSFAVDPRQDKIEDKFKAIFDKYDFDTGLEDVKERIEKRYSGTFAIVIKDALEQVLGYDFMEKDYKKEILQAATWMLHTTMPHATKQEYSRDRLKFDLGKYRDFNDDLWYAAIHADQIQWPHYDVVLADEVQDFNEAQKIVLGKLSKAGAKIVAVGDPNQSIYRFRGADAGAFGNISNTLKDLSGGGDWKPFPLSKNYRSRPEVLDFANQNTHVKDLKAGKTFDDGKKGVTSRGDMKYTDTFDTLKKEKQNGQMRETAYIARTNEPLVHAGLKLLANGIPFVIIGKDMSRDLLKQIDKVVNMSKLSESSHVSELHDRIQGNLDSELEYHGGSSSKKAYLQELSDTSQAIINAIEAFMLAEDGRQMRDTASFNQRNTTNIGAFKKWLIANLSGLDVTENEKDLKKYQEKLKQNPVILTTAHKSKGLEFDRVYILRDDQFPHAKAKRPEDLEQEANARYVAYTRAKNEIHVLDLKGQPGVKDE